MRGALIDAARKFLAQGFAILAAGICALGVFSTLFNSWQAKEAGSKAMLFASIAAFLGIVYRYRHRLLSLVESAVRCFDRFPSGWFWITVLGGGVLIRCLWWHYVPFRSGTGSDPDVNWALTLSLINEHRYVAESPFGTWRGLYPPGLPFALLPFVSLFGANALAVLMANLVFFLAGAGLLFGACRQLVDRAHARFALLLLAFLPNLFIYSSQPFKEPLLVAELAGVLLMLSLARQSQSRKAAWLRAMLGGLALGSAVLTQSSLGPALGLVALLTAMDRARPFATTRAVALVLGAVLLIAPWSIRQSQTFEKFVPLTTGAGWSFYTSNNPVTRGEYTDYRTFFPDLLSIDERELSRVSFERGTAYVKAHPQRFVELTLLRQLTMTCCLDSAVLYTLAPAGYSPPVRQAWRAVACASWMLLALVVVSTSKPLIRAASLQPLLALALSLPAVSFLIHSVMETGSRHMTMHLGIWILAAVAGLHARTKAGPVKTRTPAADHPSAGHSPQSALRLP